jgi:hypothetical protein
MTRLLVRASALSITLAILVAVSGGATQIIPIGVDYWRTPLNGTKFKFPEKDVESLCKANPDPSWNHEVTLRGIPTQGSDWDSAVVRLLPAVFDKQGNAKTKVQFKSLALISTAPSNTPCGSLLWTARLAKGLQPITWMRLTKKSDRGGVFFAELALRVEMQANDFNSGAHVGSLFFDIKLPDPAGGTQWSFAADGRFRPGVTETDNCIQVLRQKLGTIDPSSQHFYFISDLIARGVCRKQ